MRRVGRDFLSFPASIRQPQLYNPPAYSMAGGIGGYYLMKLPFESSKKQLVPKDLENHFFFPQY
jgi:hypothetical protein